MSEQAANAKIVHTVELDGPRPNLMCQEGQFKGRPMIHVIYLDGYGKPLSLGIGKVKMLLHAIPELKAFYVKHGASLDKSDD